MKVAVFTRCRVPLSVGIYRDHVIDAAEGAEVAFEAFGADEEIPPSADLIWDPTLAGTTRPHNRNNHVDRNRSGYTRHVYLQNSTG